MIYIKKAMSPIAFAKQEPAKAVKGITPAPSAAVHLALAGCSAVLLAFCLISPPAGAMRVGVQLLETSLLLIAPLLIFPAYMNERKSWDKRDSTLMLPWILVLAALVTQLAPTMVSHAFPLKDTLWRRLDESLWINTPEIMAFAARHPFLQSLLNYSYAWTLHPLLICAIFLPTCLGKRISAQRFTLSNAFAFLLASPCMLFLPAVGPWVAWHFAPNHAQQACEASIYALRTGVISSGDSFGGIICFPSFHVYWAVVSAYALKSFRLLRYPAAVLAGLITVSTMTTGWHYGVDVLAGLFLALITTLLANRVLAVGHSSTESLSMSH